MASLSWKMKVRGSMELFCIVIGKKLAVDTLKQIQVLYYHKVSIFTNGIHLLKEIGVCGEHGYSWTLLHGNLPSHAHRHTQFWRHQCILDDLIWMHEEGQLHRNTWTEICSQWKCMALITWLGTSMARGHMSKWILHDDFINGGLWTNGTLTLTFELNFQHRIDAHTRTHTHTHTLVSTYFGWWWWGLPLLRRVLCTWGMAHSSHLLLGCKTAPETSSESQRQ